MSALTKPETSQVLLIDPLTGYLEQLEEALATKVARRFEYLVAANKVFVPRNHAVSTEVGSADAWLSRPCEKRTSRVFRFDRNRSVWSNGDLASAIKKENRTQLYVCGFWLDDVVAATAIEAQTLAFDTHIITDLSLAYSRERWQPFLDRLMQYGVVPILLHTLLYEWMTNTEDSDKRQALEMLWQKNRRIESKNAFPSPIGRP